MKKNLLAVGKIYIITILIFVMLSVIYAAIILKNININFSYAKIIIGGISFFLLGFLSANFHQKKGLLISLVYGVTCLIIIYASVILIGSNITLMTLLRYLIFLLFAVFGGTIGVNVKKIV